MLSSCATVFMARDQKIRVKAVDSTLTYSLAGKDSIYSTPNQISVRRSGKSFQLNLNDTTTEIHKIPSQVNGLCYSNLFTYPSYIGFIVDLVSGKGYSYPKQLLLTHKGIESVKFIDVDRRITRPRERGDFSYFICWPIVSGSHYATQAASGNFTNVGIISTGFEIAADAKTSLSIDGGYNFRSYGFFESHNEVETFYTRILMKYHINKWSIGGGIHLTNQNIRVRYETLQTSDPYPIYLISRATSRKIGPSISFEYHMSPGFSMGVDYLPSFLDLNDFSNSAYQDFWMAGNLKFYIPLVRGRSFKEQFNRLP
jgi:hypothetical protein